MTRFFALLTILTFATMPALGGCSLFDTEEPDLDEDEGPADDAPATSEFLSVLPDPDRLAVNLPGDGVMPISYSTEALGDISDYYLVTHDVTDDVNRYITEVLDIIRDITSYQGTWIGPYTLAWGPIDYDALDPCLAYFYVQWEEDGSWSWALMEWPRGGDLDDGVIEAAGQIEPGATPLESSGWFAVDYTLRQQMDPTREISGEVLVEYEVDQQVTSAAALFSDFVWYPGDDPTDALYVYESELYGAGDVLFGFIADLDGNGDDEAMAIYSRWLADGSGRSDSTVAPYVLGAQVHISECWGSDFMAVYHEDDAGWTQPFGDEADCAFSPAVYPADVEI
jgi:hypothetical protein